MADGGGGDHYTDVSISSFHFSLDPYRKAVPFFPLLNADPLGSLPN